VQLVRNLIDAYNARDAGAFCSHAAHDVDLRPPVSLLHGRAYVGHDGVAQWLRDVEESFDRARIESNELRELGLRVLMLGSFLVRGRGSQVKVDSELAVICHFDRSDRLTCWEGYLSHTEGLRMAGASE
jgi:hypothetical protein